MFSEEFGKGGNRNVEGVCAVVLFKSCELSLGTDTFRLLELFDLGLGLGIDFVGQRTEGLFRRVVEKSPLLE